MSTEKAVSMMREEANARLDAASKLAEVLLEQVTQRGAEAYAHEIARAYAYAVGQAKALRSAADFLEWEND